MDTKTDSGLHTGHRQRLLMRFLNGGLSLMCEHEILELMLTYSIPRRDVNPLAHRLINRYGSLNAVLSADPRSLIANEGVSPRTAGLLHLFGKLSAGSVYSASRSNTRLANVSQAADYCRSMLAGEDKEASLVVLLDRRFRVADCFTAYGDQEHVAGDNAALIGRAYGCGASYVILAHSHPSERAEVSEADRAMIASLTAMLNSFTLRLSEVFIIAGRSCYAVLHNVLMEDAGSAAEADAAELPLAVAGGRSARRKAQ